MWKNCKNSSSTPRALVFSGPGTSLGSYDRYELPAMFKQNEEIIFGVHNFYITKGLRAKGYLWKHRVQQLWFCRSILHLSHHEHGFLKPNCYFCLTLIQLEPCMYFYCIPIGSSWFSPIQNIWQLQIYFCFLHPTLIKIYNMTCWGYIGIH